MELDATFKELGNEKLFQEKLCYVILYDNELALQLSEIIDTNYFNLIYVKVIVEEYYKYFKQHKVFPTIDMLENDIYHRSDVSLNEILRNLVGEVFENFKKVRIVDDPDVPAIRERVVEFCRKQNVRKAMLRVQEMLKTAKFDEIAEVFNKALQQGMENDAGFIYDEDPQRMINCLTERVPVSSGWEGLDVATNGGFGRGELTVFIAPTGGGKSTFLVNVGANALKMGHTVVHYTFELEDVKNGLRYTSFFTGIPYNDFVEIDHERTTIDRNGKKHIKMRVKESAKPLITGVREKYWLPESKLYIKQYPSRQATVDTIRSHLFSLGLKGVHPDIILVDYADIMKTSSKRRERWEELEELYSELRTLASEQDCPVITCSQTNREGYDNEMVTLKQIAGAYAKSNEVDLALCFSRTMIDKGRGTARALIAKNRNGKEGQLFPINYYDNIFRMDFLPSCTFDDLPDGFRSSEKDGLKYILKKHGSQNKSQTA